MADGVTFEIEGMEALLGKIREVQYDTRYKGGRAALRKAAQVVREAAKDGARRIDDPATAEAISQNIVERWNGRLFKRTQDLGFRVGVLGGARATLTARAAQKSARRRSRNGTRSLGQLGEIEGRGKENPGGDTYYWRFVEFGTKRTRAQPFMRPALEGNIDQATNAFVTEYQKALDRAIRRAQKKGTKA